MRHRIDLPPQLGQAFGLPDAAAVGVGRWRRDTPDLERPFRGVRATSKPETFAEIVACYGARLRSNQRYVGRTAVRIWGIPHHEQWRLSEFLEIAVPRGATPPKTKGVRGRRLVTHRATTYTVGDARVVDPIAAILTCAKDLTVDQAVIMIDAIVTTADNYPGLLPVGGRPRITLSDIEARLAEWGAFSGHRTIRSAFPLARDRVESPKETETRLMLIHAGLPEPVVQHEVREGQWLLARVDLAYPDLKIAIEYEGDGHRTGKDQWRADIRRQRDLEDRGWIVIRLTQYDLGAGAAALISRIRRAIAARSH
ncbi:endonuclease domain-containing protein [Microbacterium aurantiacum]|uniref:endonuclease domain-containing protein n=1 Tax=Microbacterium aurantiacum TaxID=162393 RepID=UPI0011AF5465|nr:hypothetical protein [Microbacterium aurantiacum]